MRPSGTRVCGRASIPGVGDPRLHAWALRARKREREDGGEQERHDLVGRERGDPHAEGEERRGDEKAALPDQGVILFISVPSSRPGDRNSDGGRGG